MWTAAAVSRGSGCSAQSPRFPWHRMVRLFRPFLSWAILASPSQAAHVLDVYRSLASNTASSARMMKATA